ncbi:MAG: PEP-CTERM system TPR-repeat protein PrsT [Burkholderiales bacterium]|nr:PEP-CTERM system TPR-repeat protein PrsT [Burkholderiales bacterium]
MKLRPTPHLSSRPRGWRLALGAGMVTLALAASAATDPKASRLYEDALQRYEKKDHAGAVVQLKNALQIDKNLLPVHVLLGKALLAQSQPIPAEAALLEALRLGVSREEVVVPLAKALLDMGRARQVLDDERFAEKGLGSENRFALLVLKAGAADDVGDSKLAMQLLETARTIDASSPDTWVAETKLRIRAGQWAEAKVAADKAVSLAPTQAAALYVRASLSHSQGDLKGALALYDKLLQHTPAHVDALVSRAGLLLDQKRTSDAARDVAAALKAQPNESRALYLQAQIAQLEGRAADAKAALHRVTAILDVIPIEMLRYRPQLLMLGGLAHYDLDQTEKAKPYLEGVLREQPGSPAAKLMARIHLKERNFDRAVEALDTYTRLHPRDVQATLLLASAHMAHGRYPRAIALLQSALQREVRPELQDALAMAYMKSGQFKSALAVLETAWKRNPGSVYIGSSLAGLYLQLGQPARAVAVAETLAKSGKDQPALQFLLGKARLEAGDAKGARTALEAAANANPRFVDPQVELARLDIRSRNFEAAEKRLMALVKREPKHMGLLSTLGQLHAAQGQLDQAQLWFEKADDHSAPDMLDHGMQLVEFNLARGRIDLAREALKRVTIKSPDAMRVLVMAARVELASGDPRAAKSTLARASSAAANDPGGLVFVGDLQLAAGDVAGAAYTANKALKEAPQLLGAQVLQARASILQGELPGAEQTARELVARLPKSGIGHALLGDIAVARKQDAAAASAYRRAHEIDGTRSSLITLFTHLTRTQPAESIRLAEQWLKKHPQDVVVWRSLADAQARAGDWAGSRRSYETLLQSSPDDAEALNNLANVLLVLKDPLALKTAERAHALKPAAPHIISTLGWAAHKAGQADRALQLLRDARLRNPDSSETRYYLGAALAAAGRGNEAKAELQAAIGSGRAFASLKDAQALLDTLK